MELILGDCLKELSGIADNSIDSIVCDPPYGISFMSKKWDYDIPSVDIWKECLRVLKPGGHALIACGTRAQHRMVVNIEEKEIKGAAHCNLKMSNASGQTKPNNIIKLQNHHPTVKPIKLMEYLIKLITPENGKVLDCFMGSGSTGVAAVNLGFDFIGIELNEEYHEIASKRIEHARQQA